MKLVHIVILLSLISQVTSLPIVIPIAVLGSLSLIYLDTSNYELQREKMNNFQLRNELNKLKASINKTSLSNSTSLNNTIETTLQSNSTNFTKSLCESKNDTIEPVIIKQNNSFTLESNPTTVSELIINNNTIQLISNINSTKDNQTSEPPQFNDTYSTTVAPILTTTVSSNTTTVQSNNSLTN